MRRRSDPHDDPPKTKPRDEPGPVPTLVELRSTHRWWWLYCAQIDCSHSAQSDRSRQTALMYP